MFNFSEIATNTYEAFFLSLQLQLLLSYLPFMWKDRENDDKENPYTPLQLPAKSTEFVESGNKFSFDFIDRIDADAEKDYIVSPLGLQIALGMLLNGAQAESCHKSR